MSDPVPTQAPPPSPSPSSPSSTSQPSVDLAASPPPVAPQAEPARPRRTAWAWLKALFFVSLLAVGLLHMHVTLQKAVVFVRLGPAGQAGAAGAPAQAAVPQPPPGGRADAPTPPAAAPSDGPGVQHPSAPGQAAPTPPPVTVTPPPSHGERSEEGGSASKGLGGVLAGVLGLLNEKPGSDLLLTPQQTERLIEVIDDASSDILLEMGILGATPQKVMATMTDSQRAYVETHPPGNQKGFDPLGPKVIAMLVERAGVRLEDLPSPSPFPAVDNRNAIMYLEGLMTLETSPHKITREQARQILPYVNAMVKAHRHQKELERQMLDILSKEQRRFIDDLLEQVPNGQPPPNADATTVLHELRASQQH